MAIARPRPSNLGSLEGKTATPDLGSYLGKIWGQFGDRAKEALKYQSIVEDFEASTIDQKQAVQRICSVFAKEKRFLQALLEHFNMEREVDPLEPILISSSATTPISKTTPTGKTTPASKTTPISKTMPTSKRKQVTLDQQDVEEVMQRHLDRWQRSYNTLAKKWLMRNREIHLKDPQLRSEPSASANNHWSISSIQNAQQNGISLFDASVPGAHDSRISAQSVKISSVGPGKMDRVTQTSRNIATISYQDATVEMPSYHYYLPVLRTNILSENSKKLNYIPMEIQREDDAPLEPNWYDEYQARLQEFYTDGMPLERALPLINAEKAKHVRLPIMKALNELGCTTVDILHFILGGVTTMTHEEAHQAFELEIEWDRSETMLAKLPKSTYKGKADIEDICNACENVTGFKLWYILRDALEITAADAVEGPPTSESSNSMMCRPCFHHICTAHGEFEENRKMAEEKTGRKFDLDHVPGSINYRLTATTVLTGAGYTDNELLSSSDSEDAQHIPRPKSYQHWHRKLELYWQRRKNTLVNNNRGQFYPCAHEGSCDEAADCTCVAAGVNCEKTCGCAQSCARRFTGCDCKRVGRVCLWNTKHCVCWQMERECDPDLCGRCGAAEALDPNTNNDSGKKPKPVCRNVCIQRGVPKRLLVATSRVDDGFGLFTGEPVKEGEFLEEYKGELLSDPEADRRQALHQHGKEYLFNVNKDQQIDGKDAGSKVRFVNNSQVARNINCNPVPLLVNGVIHMALFAKVDLPVGVELFFKYGYTDAQVAEFKEVSKTAESVHPVVQRGLNEPDNILQSILGTPGTMIATPSRAQSNKRDRGRIVIDDSENSSVENNDAEEDTSEAGRRRETDDNGQSTTSLDSEYMDDDTPGPERPAAASGGGRKSGRKISLTMRQRPEFARLTRGINPRR